MGVLAVKRDKRGLSEDKLLNLLQLKSEGPLLMFWRLLTVSLRVPDLIR